MGLEAISAVSDARPLRAEDHGRGRGETGQSALSTVSGRDERVIHRPSTVRAGQSAERPVAGAILVFTDEHGTEVARITSRADGTFLVELAPGSYRMTPQPVDGLMGTPEPMDVEVASGQPMAELQVSYDTGIR